MEWIHVGGLTLKVEFIPIIGFVCGCLSGVHSQVDLLQEWILRAGEMAQWLRAPAALPEVLSSIPSNHMVAYNHL